MENQEITKITMQVGDRTTNWETNCDCDMNDILWGFFGLLVGNTWYPSTVLSGMKDFIKEFEKDNELS
jgi:hypothetical protein